MITMKGTVEDREDRLSVIEKRLTTLRDAVDGLIILSARIRGDKPVGTPEKPISTQRPTRPLMLLLTELPEELSSLADTITKETENIKSAIY